MSQIIIPGFPEEVSNRIEMPDIAELLAYPIFRMAEADTVRKFGTEFQKKLLDLCPISHKLKHVTVYSSVHIMRPGVRPVSTGSPDPTYKEWHIDGHVEDASGIGFFQHFYPEERVHLLLGHSQFTTEFNVNPVIIPEELHDMDIKKFNGYMNYNEEKLGIVGRAAEVGRIYTFSNHIHRAPEPHRTEFRFTWRVRETNRVDIPPINMQIHKENKFYDVNHKNWFTNIRREGNEVCLWLPESKV